MAESVPDLRNLPKREAYAQLGEEAASVLAGMRDEIAMMASLSSLVHHSLGFLWTGFYRVVQPGLLRIGPYQGTLGCLEIPFGRGVCGTAAKKKQTVIVPDVRKFPAHIACDSRALSEIVVPVFSASGELTAVFDVDSDRLNAFDSDDAAGLERLAKLFAGSG
jgi:L-methionine (R)-S-oxide reductase